MYKELCEKFSSIFQNQKAFDLKAPREMVTSEYHHSVTQFNAKMSVIQVDIQKGPKLSLILSFFPHGEFLTFLF